MHLANILFPKLIKPALGARLCQTTIILALTHSLILALTLILTRNRTHTRTHSLSLSLLLPLAFTNSFIPHLRRHHDPHLHHLSRPPMRLEVLYIDIKHIIWGLLPEYICLIYY